MEDEERRGREGGNTGQDEWLWHLTVVEEEIDGLHDERTVNTRGGATLQQRLRCGGIGERRGGLLAADVGVLRGRGPHVQVGV